LGAADPDVKLVLVKGCSDATITTTGSGFQSDAIPVPIPASIPIPVPGQRKMPTLTTGGECEYGRSLSILGGPQQDPSARIKNKNGWE